MIHMKCQVNSNSFFNEKQLKYFELLSGRVVIGALKIKFKHQNYVVFFCIISVPNSMKYHEVKS